tara:strand:- start:353 stop:604 length:252 start_codon:yes stop_codon:yes gene_type:complete
MKRKKPTIMEVKTAIDNILVEMDYMYNYIRNIDSSFAAYIDFNKDGDKFKKWLDKALKEKNDQKKKGSIPSSPGDNKRTKKGK